MWKFEHCCMMHVCVILTDIIDEAVTQPKCNWRAVNWFNPGMLSSLGKTLKEKYQLKRSYYLNQLHSLSRSSHPLRTKTTRTVTCAHARVCWAICARRSAPPCFRSSKLTEWRCPNFWPKEEDRRRRKPRRSPRGPRKRSKSSRPTINESMVFWQRGEI